MSSNPFFAPLAQNSPSERPTIVRYRVLGFLTLAAAIAYVTRNAVSVAESTIRADLNLTLRQSGWFMGAFFWSYAVFQVPGGWLAQQRGTRLVMAVFACSWSVAALLIGLAPGLGLLLAAQLLMGAAQAGIFPASCLSVSHWIPLARRTFACGCLAMGMQVGAIGAGLLTGPLVNSIHWRWVFAVYAIPGFLWAIVFLLRVRDDPRSDVSVNAAELALITQHQNRKATGDAEKAEITAAEPTPWKKILSMKAIWFLCGQQVCRASGYMFFASWFPTLLQETRGVSVKDSGYLQALVFAGTLAGCLVGGLLTDWIWRRTGSLRFSRSGVGATFLFGCSMLILGAWFVENVTLAVTLLAFGTFFAALAGPCAFSATIDIGGAHTPQVFGLMNMTGNFAAAACPILVAELFEWTSNWMLVLLVFSGIYLAGAICWAMVDVRCSIEE